MRLTLAARLAAISVRVGRVENKTAPDHVGSLQKEPGSSNETYSGGGLSFCLATAMAARWANRASRSIAARLSRQGFPLSTLPAWLQGSPASSSRSVLVPQGSSMGACRPRYRLYLRFWTARSPHRCSQLCFRRDASGSRRQLNIHRSGIHRSCRVARCTNWGRRRDSV
jgi:hypothetical protein